MERISDIDPRHVMLMEADSNYTILHLKSGEKIISGYHLAYHEQQLAGQILFVRPNRKYAVNIDYIKRYKHDILYVKQLKIPISRRRQETVRILISKHQVA
jgi:two-component system LytT family response regulator